MEYKEEKRICQNCKKDFIIEPEDFNFYEKIKVPAPTFCPECRFLRRIAFGNYYNFYKRDCGYCGKNVICIYSEEGGTKMYCNSCWWSDNWDGAEYGVDYDENKYFFDQLISLRKNTPFMAFEALFPSLVNTLYTNHASYQKNCFMTIMADYNENCAYSTLITHTKDSMDCYRINESELCYECVGVSKSYSCSWSEEIDNCVNCNFCQSCNGCSDCLGCVNLKNKSYCVFNVQYSKDEYFDILKNLNLDNFNNLEGFKNKAEEFWIKSPKKFYKGNGLNINVTGDYIFESKNTKESYLVTGLEDCKYTQFITLRTSKDCFDYTSWGSNASLMYESYIVGENSSNIKFSTECWPNSRDIEYSYYCINCKDCFGCINLKKKQYCILNKQYSKEEYFILREKIINDMNNNPWKNKAGHIYSYGEFLPPELSAFSYQESISGEYNLLEKEDAINAGFNWVDISPKKYQITLNHKDIPLNINTTNENIKTEVLECEKCGRGFNISNIEFELLNKLKQPIPHHCSNCRHKRRFDRTNKPKFYDRKCSKCGDDIRTSYSPERPEIIYCEKCYQQEVF